MAFERYLADLDVESGTLVTAYRPGVIKLFLPKRYGTVSLSHTAGNQLTHCCYQPFASDSAFVPNPNLSGIHQVMDSRCVKHRQLICSCLAM